MQQLALFTTETSCGPLASQQKFRHSLYLLPKFYLVPNRSRCSCCSGSCSRAPRIIALFSLASGCKRLRVKLDQDGMSDVGGQDPLPLHLLPDLLQPGRVVELLEALEEAVAGLHVERCGRQQGRRADGRVWGNECTACSPEKVLGHWNWVEKVMHVALSKILEFVLKRDCSPPQNMKCNHLNTLKS